MKSLVSILVLGATLITQGHALDDNLLILGMEARLGYKIAPTFRGHKLAHYLIDQQFSSGFSISSISDINFAFYHYSTFEAQKYGNWGFYMDNPWSLNKNHQLAPFFALNYYDDTIFRNGLESGLKWIYRPSKTWTMELSSLYDSGQEGAYSQFQVIYSPQISKNMILRSITGLGAAHRYLNYSGLSEIYTQVSIPIIINMQWSVEPSIRFTQTFNKNDRFILSPGVLFSFIF